MLYACVKLVVSLTNVHSSDLRVGTGCPLVADQFNPLTPTVAIWVQL